MFKILRQFFQAVCFFGAISVNAQQQAPFTIRLEAFQAENFSGLHSYTWATANDKILLIGGRTDGLHKRQPFASFKAAYNNTDIIVIDPASGKTWKKSLSSIDPIIGDQLQSSNMEFYQDGSLLILAGGYGYSAVNQKHITYPSLVMVKVPELADAIIQNKDIKEYFIRMADDRMAIAGGKLNKLGNEFYLTGGHRFDGAYNPHGPDHGPGYSQQYSNQIRKFTISTDKGSLLVSGYHTVTDTVLLHRRDFNILPETDVAGNPILTMFAGVFQYNKDLPFTTIVDISQNSLKEISGFNQQYCHYHTASFSIRDAQTQYSIFFGGIAMNTTDSAGKFIADNNVPFVKHISVVERKNESFSEYLLPVQMEGYYGASAEFIPATTTGLFKDGMLDITSLGPVEQFAGYIPGGIRSSGPNVLWSNDPLGSTASPVIWKVYISKK